MLPSPPLSPSPASRERGNAQQGAPPCAPTPLAHSVGEGLRVRAKKRAHPAHSEPKRCTLIRPEGEGIMNSGRTIGIIPIARAEFTIAPLLKVPPASRGEPSRASVRFLMRTGGRGHTFSPSPQPLSHAVGEGGRGARRCALLRVPPLPPRGRGGLWSAEAKLPPTLKLTLQHSKQVSARLPSPTLWERSRG